MSAREASAEMGVGSVYRAWIGGLKCRVCSGDGAGSAGPAARPCASRTRKLTFTHTGSPRISRRASGSWTARRCAEARPAAPLGAAWSTHQASPNGLHRRSGRVVSPGEATGSKAHLLQRTCARCISAAQEDLDLFGSLDSAAPPLSHPELLELWKSRRLGFGAG